MAAVRTDRDLPSAERALLVRQLGLVPTGVGCFLMGGGSPGETHAPFEFLLVLRRGSHGEGTWAPPGGWVDAGEDPYAAVAREVWEEVGVTLEPGDVHELGWTWNKHPEGLQNVTLWFQAATYKGTPRSTHDSKVASVGWYIRDLLPMPLFAGFEPAVAKGLVP